MMSLDAPRCLKVEELYVGDPKVSPQSDRRRSAVWLDPAGWRSTTVFRSDVVEECFDTVATLRDYRSPLEGEAWTIPAASERRLLAQINAIAALGNRALRQVADLLMDADIADPGRVFAGLLILGSIDGNRWLDTIQESFLSALLRDRDEAVAAVEAIGLCANPAVPELLRGLLSHPSADVRAGAVDAFVFRGELQEHSWAEAMHDPDRAVVSAALHGYLGGYRRRVCEEALTPLWSGIDAGPLRELALRAGSSLRLESVYDYASSGQPSNHVLYYLGLYGRLKDVDLIHERFARKNPSDAVRGAVALGSVQLVPGLIEQLERDDLPAGVKTLIEQSLISITGLAFDEAENVAQMHQLWSRHASSFQSGVRYMDGDRWNLWKLIQRLHRGPGDRESRESAYFEALVTTGSDIPRFNAFEFVATQQGMLRSIDRWLAGSQGAARSGSRYG